MFVPAIAGMVQDKMKETGYGFMLTGEKNVFLSDGQLCDKLFEMDSNFPSVLMEESVVLSHNGLIFRAEDGRISIPDWNNFITQMYSLNEVCYKAAE